LGDDDVQEADLKDTWFADLATRALALAPYPDPRFPPSPYDRFFKVLTQSLQPTLSVELGLCGGGGAFHMATGWPGGMVVGVEHEAGDAHQQANWRFMRDKLPNFVLWQGDSVRDAPSIAKVYGLCQLLFIDTTHTYEQTTAEWNAWLPFLDERKTVICFDDLFRPGMDRVWAEVPWQKLRLDSLHTGAEQGGGFGVAWRG
jgi:predicted O-methyltransferase YrrM